MTAHVDRDAEVETAMTPILRISDCAGSCRCKVEMVRDDLLNELAVLVQVVVVAGLLIVVAELMQNIRLVGLGGGVGDIPVEQTAIV